MRRKIKNIKKFQATLKKILLEIGKKESKERFYSNVSQEDFDLAVGLDPTATETEMGKYSKWLLLKKNLEIIKRTRKEDLYKIKEDLKKYHELKRKNLIPQDKKNIDDLDINSLAELIFSLTREEKELKTKRELEREVKNQEAEKWKIGDWLIVNPKTERASCLYGAGTRWCTAATEGNNMFDEYNRDGKLWILTNSKTKRKYQFHFERLQFKDELDEDISLKNFFAKNKNVKNFFEEQGYEDYVEIAYFLEDDDPKNDAPSMEHLELEKQKMILARINIPLWKALENFSSEALVETYGMSEIMETMKMITYDAPDNLILYASKFEDYIDDEFLEEFLSDLCEKNEYFNILKEKALDGIVEMLENEKTKEEFEKLTQRNDSFDWVKHWDELKNMNLKGVQVNFEDCSVERDDEDGKIKLIVSAMHNGKKKYYEFDEFKEKLTKNEFAKRNIANESAKWLNKWRNFKRNARKRILFEITKSEAKERFYSNISQEDFDLAVGLDPTATETEMGSYSKWLLLKKNLDIIKRTKEEDLYKIKEDLKKYDALKKKNLIPADKKDIGKLDINSLAELIFSLTREEEELKTKRELEKEVKDQEAEKWKIGDWLIINPKTKQASCLYGAGSRWCTAATESKNYFEEYNKKGKLWILINKKENEKYQFHFEDLEFKDAQDSAISIKEFFSANKKIKNFFESLGYQNLINLALFTEDGFNGENLDMNSYSSHSQKKAVERIILLKEVDEFYDYLFERDSVEIDYDILKIFDEKIVTSVIYDYMIINKLASIAIKMPWGFKDLFEKYKNAFKKDYNIDLFFRNVNEVAEEKIPYETVKTICSALQNANWLHGRLEPNFFENFRELRETVETKDGKIETEKYRITILDDEYVFFPEKGKWEIDFRAMINKLKKEREYDVLLSWKELKEEFLLDDEE